MVTAQLMFRTRPYKEGEALSAVDCLLDSLAQSARCGRARLLADVHDGRAFTLTTEWTDPSAAAAFFESGEFMMFRGLRILLRDEMVLVIDDVRTRVTRVIGGPRS